MKKTNPIPQEEKSALLQKHYERLMEIIGDEKTYATARIRFACTILTVTGMRIGELGNLQFKNLNSLFENQRPHVDLRCLKEEGPQRTAFLNKRGKELINERKADYDFIFQHLDKNSDDFVFAVVRHKGKVTRTYIPAVIKKYFYRN